MSNYKPQSGDFVHLYGHDRQFKVTADVYASGVVHVEGYVDVEDVTPVAPPLPSEPDIGTVVWVNGKGFVNRGGISPWYSAYNAGRLWNEIAAKAEPMVPVSKVAEWIDRNQHTLTANDFLLEFGWGDQR